MDAVFEYLDLILFLVLLVIGYVIGGLIERRHYQSIRQREQALLGLAAVPSEILPGMQFQSLGMVSGNCVISVDYFKRFAAGLRNFFGGRVSAYETLMDRARREAILRLKEAAVEAQADMILNVRTEMASFGVAETYRRGGAACVEVIAYGTAIRQVARA